jgi:hypothetical protein
VTVSAHPGEGWSFLQWSGDLAGTNAMAGILMDRDQLIHPVFGTTVTTAADGKGSLQIQPSGPLYTRGDVLNVMAIPDHGHFFSQWTGAAAGTNNPARFTVGDPEPVVVGSFSPLPAGYYTVTLLTEGAGTASKIPDANFYTNGTAMTLTATPDPGSAFLGWSGDVRSEDNPHQLELKRSIRLTAHFTGSNYILLTSPELRNETNLVFQLISEPGQGYELRYATNLLQTLTDWTPLLTGTNTTGQDLITNMVQPAMSPRFYRVLTQP